ncbi:hypothetical protein BLA39750_01238 [Burkholderia lata]|uniref:Conjugal transfer protein TraB n=1 Tax=Burkholderia lata (strain ATCC 17760 / DSM 23089 / LMG 22485 / NCIMB 9086 / R18194 / 383) TaxID=482957 RepID=A0A6P2VJ13_BURL3|nr:hypothetical protein BLA39750_01238 [Burkholderia lata]
MFGCGVQFGRPPFATAGYIALPVVLWCLRGLGTRSLTYLFSWYLGALASVAVGVIDVGAGVPMALTIWLALSLLSTLCTVPAFRRDVSAMERAAWVFVPLSLPPFALFVPVPPSAAAGWWFPSSGALGLLFLIWAAASLVKAVSATAWRPIVIPVFVAACLNIHAWDVAEPVTGVVPISLAVDQPPSDFDGSIRAALRYGPIVRDFARRAKAAGEPTQTILLPENVLGAVSPGLVKSLDLPPDVRLVAGGSGKVPWADHLQKGVWVLPDRIFYPAIQPIPLIEEGLRPHWSAIGHTAKIGDSRYTLVVCYESVTALPIYHLRYGSPILLLGNGWWDRHGIMGVEVSLARAWARLFNAPIAISRGLPLIGKAP